MRFAAIADDLTGAVELASYLVREGVPSRVLTSRATAEDVKGCFAPVFGLKVRTVPKRVALRGVKRALDILRPFNPNQLFYKYCATFDSTPRGNIGPIADLLSRERGVDFTGFCPAFPEVDRTVYRGHLFAADTSDLSLSEAFRSADSDARAGSRACAAAADRERRSG